MKDVEFAKTWRRRKSETVVEEYPAGSKPSLSPALAKAAFDAGVLKGEPIDTPSAQPNADAPDTKKKA